MEEKMNTGDIFFIKVRKEILIGNYLGMCPANILYYQFLILESFSDKSLIGNYFTCSAEELKYRTKLEKGTKVEESSLNMIGKITWEIYDIDTINEIMNIGNKTYNVIKCISFSDFLNEYEPIKESSIQEEIKPKNNDGRQTCAWCSAPTKKVSGISNWYDICSKCGK